MYLGYHSVSLSTNDDGYTVSDPPDPVVLKAKQKAGYDFVVYWLYVGISYAGITYGLAKQRAEQRRIDSALARSRQP
jgi:hypothetical protein